MLTYKNLKMIYYKSKHIVPTLLNNNDSSRLMDVNFVKLP